MSILKFPMLLAPMLLISSLWVTNATATTVLPATLPDMTAAADVIFHGRVISNEVKRDPVTGKTATFTEFDVIEPIKGATGKTHTIKQFGGRLPDSKRYLVVHGVPQFQTGQAYVVFLPKPSRLGFSSPIGLSQGKFDVLKHNGEILVSNGRSLAALTGASAQQNLSGAPGAITVEPAPALKTVPGQPTRAYLDDFLQTVRGIAGE